MLVSEKNGTPHHDLKNSMDFNFLARRPGMEFACSMSHQNTQQALAPPEKEVIQPRLPELLPCSTSQIAHCKEDDGGQLKSSEEKHEDNFDMFVASLKVKIPSSSSGDGDDEGLKTPTSSDHKITVNFQCPPAPRKPKSLPIKKRKHGQPRILLHLSNEIESLFPPENGDLLADLGGKIKKKLRV